MVELSAGASVAVSLIHCAATWPDGWPGVTAANVYMYLARSDRWPCLHQRTERRPHTTAEVTSARRREGGRL
jgi:hypothetical protein